MKVLTGKVKIKIYEGDDFINTLLENGYIVELKKEEEYMEITIYETKEGEN